MNLCIELKIIERKSSSCGELVAITQYMHKTSNRTKHEIEKKLQLVIIEIVI